MQALFHTFYQTLFQPQTAMRGRTHRRHWWHAAVLLWLIASMQALTQAGQMHMSAAQMSFALFLSWGGMFLAWWICTLLLHFSADLFGGRGRFADTMTGVGLAWVPLVLTAPLAALPNLLGRFGHTLTLLAWMGLIFWVLALMCMSLSQTERFSLDRAIGSLVLSSVFATAFLFAGGMWLSMQIFFWISLAV